MVRRCSRIRFDLQAIARQAFVCGVALVGSALLGSISIAEANGRYPDRLEGHGGPVKSIVISADGRQALTTSFDYSAIHWSLAGGEARVLGRLFGHEAAVNDIVFTSEKSAASVSDDGSLVLWDLEKAVMKKRIPGTGDKILDIDVSPDGSMVALASWDQVARVYDAETGDLVAAMKGHRGNVNAVRFSPDGKTLYSVSYDGTLRSWDTRSGVFKRRLADHGWAINVLDRLPQGHLVYGSLEGTVFIMDPVSGDRIAELKKHTGPVLSLTVSKSGRLIASGGGDGRIFVSDAETGAVLEEFENPYGPVWALAFSPEGDAMFYAGLDDFVSTWTVSPRKPFEPVDVTYPRRFQVSKDVDPGEREFARKCSICHTLTKDGKFRAGPTLFGVFGRKVGTYPGYPYSEALLDADFIWSEETIDKLFALGPDEFTPGTKMPLQRIKSEEKRAALIAYLRRMTDPNNPPAPDTEQGPKKTQETKQ